MEPFGEGNPEPVFGLRGVYLADVRPLGADGRHLLLAFRDRSIPKAIWWNRGDRVEAVRAQAALPHDVVFTVEANDYQARHVELRLVDLAPAGGCASDEEGI
jgi:single-stranded-DNA-specific exonuclease